MADHPFETALELWGWSGASVTLVAARENAVYRVDHASGVAALRFHRPGLRSKAELNSELQWMAALTEADLGVPAPIAATTGAQCMSIEGFSVDALTWIEGEPMGREGSPSPTADLEKTYHDLGRQMARFHTVSDAWTPPADFTRHAWDVEGLLGERPLWGQFWENPSLTTAQRTLLNTARENARTTLCDIERALDFGLIHADLVPDNVMIDRGRIHLIDFDDGGYGFRLFDIATTLNRARRTDQYALLRSALLDGYIGERAMDLSHLPLFQAIRSFTYVGWIASRMNEPGAEARCQRLINEACEMAETLNAS